MQEFQAKQDEINRNNAAKKKKKVKKKKKKKSGFNRETSQPEIAGINSIEEVSEHDDEENKAAVDIDPEQPFKGG